MHSRRGEAMNYQNRFTNRAIKAIEYAQYEAQNLERDYIGTEHILLGLLHERAGIAARAMEAQGLDFQEVRKQVERLQVNDEEDTADNPYYTPVAKRVMEMTVQEAQELGHNYIGTEHMLLSLLHEQDGAAYQVLRSMDVDVDALREAVLSYVGKPQWREMRGTGKEKKQKSKTKTPFLDQYGRNLNELAKQDKLDPVIGREAEIERVIQILARRTKNNPILLGEPGVGKTAIAEGLAQRIVQEAVPHILMHKRVVSLSTSSLVAGAKYRGEFEERLQNMVQEIRKSGDVLLFIDEIHTLVGAGGSEGALDAANILKPALSRGEIQIIGATTLDEYKKYLEKDAALSRRFQTILVEEPSSEDALKILFGLRSRYEEFHHAKIEDEALDAAVKLSKRYISDRFLPDKAIDLMDEAASKARMRTASQPAQLKEIEERLRKLELEKEAAITAQEFEHAAHIRDAEQQMKQEMESVRNLWERQGKSYVTVTARDIADAAALWTGIPVHQIAAKESERLLHIEKALETRVIGQKEPVRALAKAIRRGRAGLKDPKRPIGSFIFLGPTGVGKTELCRALGEAMFGDEDAVIRLDMSEYMEKHTVSRLVGSPPGYVGFEEGGQLTEAVRRKPYSVVLLDEVEKAHPDVFNILLQIMEDGRLTDNTGRVVSFKNTIVVMTSNAGAHAIKNGRSLGFGAEAKANPANYEAMKDSVMKEVGEVFRPEFINRVDEIIVFHPLTEEDIHTITDMMLRQVADRLKEQDITLKWDKRVTDKLSQEGYDPKFGARPLRRLIQRTVEDTLSEALLDGRILLGSPARMTVKDGEIRIAPPKVSTVSK